MSERCPNFYTTAGHLLQCRRRENHAGLCHWWANKPGHDLRLVSVVWQGDRLL